VIRSTVIALQVAIAGAPAAAQGPGGEPLMPGMAMHLIEEPVFKGRIAVFEGGRGKARSILLVHGIGADGARDYREQIAWLRESFHVVAVDDVERLVVIAAPGVLHRHATASRFLAGLFGVSQKEFDSLGWLGRLPGKLLTPLERLGIDPQDVLADPEQRASVLGGDPAKIAGLAAAYSTANTTSSRSRAASRSSSAMRACASCSSSAPRSRSTTATSGAAGRACSCAAPRW
jgi:hypothetical protein